MCIFVNHTDYCARRNVVHTLSKMSSKQKHSAVWKFFELNDVLKTGKKIKKAQCTLCNDVQLAYKGMMMNMINHLQSKHQATYEANFSMCSSSLIQKQATLSLVAKMCPPGSAKETDHCVAEFVAKDLRPIATVDRHGFKKLVHFTQPGYSVPSRIHVMSTLRKRYDTRRMKLLVDTSSHCLAIMTYMWTSRTTYHCYSTLH